MASSQYIYLNCSWTLTLPSSFMLLQIMVRWMCFTFLLVWILLRVSLGCTGSTHRIWLIESVHLGSFSLTRHYHCQIALQSHCPRLQPAGVNWSPHCSIFLLHVTLSDFLIFPRKWVWNWIFCSFNYVSTMAG